MTLEPIDSMVVHVFGDKASKHRQDPGESMVPGTLDKETTPFIWPILLTIAVTTQKSRHPFCYRLPEVALPPGIFGL